MTSRGDIKGRFVKRFANDRGEPVTSRGDRGFILPLTMMLSLLIVMAVLHALFLLETDRSFYQAVRTHTELQEIRECALSDIDRGVKEKTLPEEGSFVYDRGAASFRTVTEGERLDIFLEITAGDHREYDQITYSLTESRPIEWIERTTAP